MRKVTTKDFSFAKKAQHVKNAEFIGGHKCHYPGCDKDVKPAYWGCLKHWYSLPEALRRRLWLHYVPGQEETKNPTAQYVAVANEIQDWIKANVR